MDPLAELLVRFRSRGDVRALGELFDRSAPRLLRLAMHLVSQAADAEDLVQQTFVLAMQKASSFDDRQPLMPWLCGILAGEARNLVRKQRRSEAEALPEIGSADREPLIAAERGELVAQLRAHVEELPIEQRQVLLMQLQHGLSPAEIAEVLEVPPGTVRMRLHRGLAALRRLLPSGTAALMLGMLPNRGLAAVRQAVLREAGILPSVAVTAGTAASMTLGVLTMKYWFGLACAAVLLGLLWWMQPGPSTLTGPRIDAAPAASQVATLDAVERVAVGADAPSPASGTRQLLNAPTGALRVQVLFDRDRQPAVGVAVYVGDFGDLGAPVLRSDANGEACFAELAPGAARVGVGSAAVLRPVIVEQLPAIVAGREVTAVLLLPCAGTVDGVVTDEHGLPLAEAEVWAGEDRDDPDLPRKAAVTDAEGRFSVPFGHQEHAVTVHKPGYCCDFAQPTFEEAGHSWRHFVLRRGGGRVDGIVRTAAGAIVDGCVLSLGALDHRSGRADDGSLWRRPPPRHALADAEGRFTFPDVAPGEYRLRALSVAGPGTSVAVAADVAVQVEVVLPPVVVLRGTVLGADGAPVAGARVHVDLGPASFGDPATSQVATHSSADGSYELRVGPGSYTLFARSEAAGACRQPVQVTNQAEQLCDLRLAGMPQVEGVVVDDRGQPMRSWHVALRVGAQQASWLLTNGLGEFRFPASADAATELVVWSPMGNAGIPALVAPLERGAPHQLLVVPAQALPAAQVRGRIVGHDGAPAAATVTLRQGNRDGLSHRCDVDGRFAFEALPPGSFVLAIEGSDKARLQVPVSIADEVATAHVRFVGAVGLSDPVPPGRYRLRCEEHDLTFVAGEHDIVAFSTTRVTLAIGIGRSLTLRFTPPEDVPFVAAERLHAQVLDASGAVVQQQVLRRAPISKPQQYDYGVTLPAGSYRVLGHTDGGLRFAMSLQVAAEPMRRDIQVPLVGR